MFDAPTKDIAQASDVDGPSIATDARTHATRALESITVMGIQGAHNSVLPTSSRMNFLVPALNAR